MPDASAVALAGLLLASNAADGLANEPKTWRPVTVERREEER